MSVARDRDIGSNRGLIPLDRGQTERRQLLGNTQNLAWIDFIRVA